MSRRSSFLVAAIFASLLTGCMTSPNNGDAMCGVEGTIAPAGWTPEPSWELAVAAAPSSAGPWTIIATPSSGTSAYPWSDKDGTTENYYSWGTGNLTLAPAEWGLEGNVRATYIKAYRPAAGSGGQDESLYSFDDPAISATHEDWFTCTDRVWSASPNMKFYQAAIQCASKTTPVVRVTAPATSTCPCTTLTTIGNDVSITTTADLAPLRCVSQITGSLSITNGASLQTVTLPQLTTIGGDLKVNMSPASGTTTPLALGLPELTATGNNVTFTGAMPVGTTSTLALGLPAMTSAGGVVSVTLTGGAATVSGLGALAALKDLTVDFGGDTDAAGLLGSLKEVKGVADVTVRAKLTGLLAGLTKVDGTFSLAHPSTATSAATIGLSSLASVGGDFDVNGVPWSAFGSAAFGKLGSVAGTIRIEQSQITTFDLGLATLTTGNLEIGDNPLLASFPFRSIVVSPAGDITIVNDPVLPTCLIGNFLDAQTSIGWNGTFSVSGTDDNAVCP